MVSHYLVALSKLGVRDELAALLDPNRLFLQVTVGELAPSHWKCLEQVLLKAEVDETWQEAVQSVRKMHNIKLNRHPDRLVQATLAEIDRRAALYLAKWTNSDHVLSRWVPRNFRVSHWALISHGDGYNVPHIHPEGWITGILYVAGPDRANASDGSPGALRVGPPPDLVESTGWPDITVAPVPGTLVLMPSYYTHWTVPLGRPGLRIAIAFDVIDLRDDADQEACLPLTA
jgi:Putative 2OG-Fe(II) oxygenase